jgi:hypothetical protein
MSPQAPSAPVPFLAAVHAWQAPRQAPSQQTESTQDVERQASAAAQGAPLASWGTQVPVEQ